MREAASESDVPSGTDIVVPDSYDSNPVIDNVGSLPGDVGY